MNCDFNLIRKLVLGAAQFTGVYGRRDGGKSSQCVYLLALEQLRLSAQTGIDSVDTAALYGDSESLVGDILHLENMALKVITKGPRVAISSETDYAQIPTLVRNDIMASLRNLKSTSVHGYLVHNASYFRDHSIARSLIDGLLQAKSDGLVSKVGVSIYTLEDIEAVLDSWTPDIVQLPISVVDQRLLTNGTLKRLKQKNVEIHSRSIFLRGALLQPAESLPRHLRSLATALDKLDNGKAFDVDNRLQQCLNFIFQIDEVDRVVVGFEDAGQLRRVIEITAKLNSMKHQALKRDWAAIAINDPVVVNPALWPA